MKISESENDANLYQWLWDHGNPCIQSTINQDTQIDKHYCQSENFHNRLLQNRIVKKWMDLSCIGLTHGSKPYAFENTIPKLAQLGFDPSYPEFIDRSEYWIDQIKIEINKQTCSYWGSFGFLANTIIAGILAYCGIVDNEKVISILDNRINQVYRYITQSQFTLENFLIPSNRYPKLTKSRQKHIVNPIFYGGGNFTLPWIYDLFGYRGLQQTKEYSKWKTKIDAIIDLILNPEYQNLPLDYGTVLTKPNYGYALGWNITLPGFFNVELLKESKKTSNLLLIMEIFAHFKSAIKSKWFQNCVQLLESFKTIRGTYRLPTNYLSEKPSGYWNMGAYMGMGEDRTTKEWCEIESTYWILKIKGAIKNSY
jgi:hypothetical protein